MTIAYSVYEEVNFAPQNSTSPAVIINSGLFEVDISDSGNTVAVVWHVQQLIDGTTWTDTPNGSLTVPIGGAQVSLLLPLFGLQTRVRLVSGTPVNGNIYIRKT